MFVRTILLALTLGILRADVRTCVCDLLKPATVELRTCSLCFEAAKRPASEPVFSVRDVDPTKPDRWLILPRSADYDGPNPLARMSAPERLALWTAAIAKAHAVWGDSWGIAMNGDLARRQCHAHVHVGKLLDGMESDKGYYIDGPALLPALGDGSGLWFHPVGSRLHVHSGEQITEPVLMR